MLLHLFEVKKKCTTFNLIIFNVFRDSCSNENYTNALANAVKFGLEEVNDLLKLKKNKGGREISTLPLRSRGADGL